MLRLLFVLLLTPFLAKQVQAAEFFDFSVFGPKYQFHSPENDISGVRIGIFYGEHNHFSGFDFVLFIAESRGDFTGVGLSGVNLVQGKFTGLQMGMLNMNHKGSNGIGIALANVNDGDGTGIEISLANIDENVTGGRLAVFNAATSFSGMEIGVVNMATKASGLQIGVINYADELYGLQIGILNFAGNSSLLYAFPVFNFHF